MSQIISTPRRSAGFAPEGTRGSASRSAGYSGTVGVRRAGLAAVAGLATVGVVAPAANAAAEVPAGASFTTAPVAVQQSSQAEQSSTGTQYTTVALNVRTGASTDHQRVTTLPKGTKVTTTGDSTSGWTEIEHDGSHRWVASRYLAGNAPSTAGTASAAASVASDRTVSASRSTERPTLDTAGLDAKRAAIVQAAYQGVGTGYVYGGTAFGAWDCSGFVLWATKQAGVTGLPRTAAAQAAALAPTSNPKPGDLVLQNGGGHIGIYVGDGMMISALNSRSGTQLHPVSWMPVSGYYSVS